MAIRMMSWSAREPSRGRTARRADGEPDPAGMREIGPEDEPDVRNVAQTRPAPVPPTAVRRQKERSTSMAKRPARGVVCPRCGVAAARIIGRSESVPAVYLRCDECGRVSVSPED